MHQAVKRAAAESVTDLSDEELVPNNDTESPVINRNIEKLRNKIKSARLEKLMASQLEAELSIDHIEIEEPDVSELHLEEEPEFISKATTLETYSDARKNEDLASDERFSFGNSRSGAGDIQRSRRTCDEMAKNIKNSSNVFLKMIEQASGMAEYLEVVEQELNDLERARIHIRELEENSDQSRIQIQEFQSTIEKQKKQIEMLEAIRKNTADAHESSKNEITQLQNALRKRDREIGNLQSGISDANRDKNSLKSELGKLELEVQHGNQALTTAREKLRNKDVELTKLVADLNEVVTDNDEIRDKFADIESKYNDLNKRGLDQQSQNYSKIHDLENLVRDLKRQIQMSNQEKAELQVELSAANNLLVLHEEMIDTLSHDKTG
ncbi:MAG: hypothetical protein ACR2O3_01735 [Rhizobiaceae bacterium]